MLAVHRPLTAGGRSSKGGSCSEWTGEARTWAQQSVASEHDGKQGTNLVGSRGLEIRQQLDKLQARAAVVEKQSTDETPMTGNPEADALKLTLENLRQDDSYDDVRAVWVDKHRNSVLEATRMKPWELDSTTAKRQLGELPNDVKRPRTSSKLQRW